MNILTRFAGTLTLAVDAIQFIRESEFAGPRLTNDPDSPFTCPECGAPKGSKHSEGCRIDNILERARLLEL